MLVGIVNGVDYGEWDPRTDPLIPVRYGPKDLSGKLECKRTLLGAARTNKIRIRTLDIAELVWEAMQ